jgi:type II secretory pathway pseudopilin PulG
MIAHSRRIGSAAFTLIEVLAVIAIIMILAGIVVGGMEYAKQRQANEKARVQIALLSKAIEEYKMDMGVYPGTDDNTAIAGDVSEQIYQALFKYGYDYTESASPPTDWDNKATKIYLNQLDPRNNKQGWLPKTTASTPGTSIKISDPWKNGYRYRKGSNAQNPDFDLWSTGKDSKTNATNSAKTEDDNKDDIRNF